MIPLYVMARGDIYKFSTLDIAYSVLLIIIIYYFAQSIKRKKIKEDSSYKYYVPALTAKIVGSISVVLIYNIYYSGGDTNYYFFDALTMTNLLFKNLFQFADIVFNGMDYSKTSYLDNFTGTFVYYRSKESFFVARIIWPFVLLGFQAMIPTAMLLAVVSFGGVWRMFKVFIAEFPQLEKQFAIAFFFLPSVFFWGSGILKDSITFSALGYFFYSFYYSFIRPEKVVKNIIVATISILIILYIKPYIFIGVLPGAVIWLIRKNIAKIEGSFIRGIVFPIILFVGIGSGYLMLNVMSSELGKFSIDKILDEAVTTNLDLKSSQYKGNSFDIGDIKPTFASMLEHAPFAINAALFRPYITEAKNFLMIVSGLENLFILAFTFYVVIRLRIVGVFKYFANNQLLSFSLIFSLFFAFSVGISTSNFGSMVRYRIPLLPFYVASLFIIKHLEDKAKEERLRVKYSHHHSYA
jgi:hypothetical protein